MRVAGRSYILLLAVVAATSPFFALTVVDATEPQPVPSSSDAGRKRCLRMPNPISFKFEASIDSMLKMMGRVSVAESFVPKLNGPLRGDDEGGWNPLSSNNNQKTEFDASATGNEKEKEVKGDVVDRRRTTARPSSSADSTTTTKRAETFRNRRGAPLTTAESAGKAAVESAGKTAAESAGKTDAACHEIPTSLFVKLEKLCETFHRFMKATGMEARRRRRSVYDVLHDLPFFDKNRRDYRAALLGTAAPPQTFKPSAVDDTLSSVTSSTPRELPNSETTAPSPSDDGPRHAGSLTFTTVHNCTNGGGGGTVVYFDGRTRENAYVPSPPTATSGNVLSAAPVGLLDSAFSRTDVFALTMMSVAVFSILNAAVLYWSHRTKSPVYRYDLPLPADQHRVKI